MDQGPTHAESSERTHLDMQDRISNLAPALRAEERAVSAPLLGKLPLASGSPSTPPCQSKP